VAAIPTDNATPSLDRVWSAPAPLGPVAIAADSRGVVIASREGDVVAIDPAGSHQWRLSLDDAWVDESLALASDLVVIPVDRDRLVALDRVTGAHRWEHEAPGADTVAVGTDVSGRTVVALVTTSGVLDVLDGATGTSTWSVQLEFDERVVEIRPFVSRDRVLAAWADRHGSHVRAFAAQDGVAAWSDDAPGFASMPIVEEASAYSAVNERLDRDKRVVARVQSVDVSDGTERWSRRLRTRFGFWAAVGTAASDEAVAVVDLNGRVTMLEAATGKVRWRTATQRRQFEATPYVVDDVFAMPTYGTGLAVLSAADGRAVATEHPGSVETAMTIAASTAVADRLYLALAWSWGDAEVWMLQAGPA
jgi:outer membrane protein assembly factor BamB